MKNIDGIEKLCKKLKPVIGEQADNLWHLYLAENEKGRKDLEHTIELVVEKYLKDEPLENKQILLNPSIKKDSKGTYLIGDVIYKNKKYHQLYLRPEDFQKQIGIFAITGEGKTNLAYLLALQLAESKTPFMVIDWKRSWRNLLSLKEKMPELKDVKIFTIGRDTIPFLWNVFRAPPGTDKDYWVGTISEALERSHLSGPGVAYYFNKIYSKLFKELPDDYCPNFFDGIRAIHNIKAYGREANWKQTALRIFQSFTLGKSKEIFNVRNPIKLEELLNGQVILELDLEMPKPLRMFFSEIILRWIHLYRLSKGETDNLEHVLFLEEVHNLFVKTGFSTESKSIENLYREVRGFGQGLVSITQHPSLLPIELLGNCHTQIYLGLQHADDISAARKSLFLDYEDEEYFNLLNVGECIVKIKNRVSPCLVKSPLVQVKKELVSDDWLRAHGASCLFREHIWEKPGGDEKYLSLKNTVSDILSGKPINSEKQDDGNTSFKDNASLETKDNTSDEKINTQGYLPMQTLRNTKAQRSSEEIPISAPPYLFDANIDSKKNKCPPKLHPQHKLLIDIFDNPFSSITKRYKRLKFNPRHGNKFKNDLISKGCVQPRKIITGKGWTTLFELTKKGRMVLGDLGLAFKNESEGVVHKFWKYKVSEYYKTLGFDVRVEEYYVNGRPDIIVKKDGKQIAIEIETGKSNYVGNIKRALEAGFDEVLCVAVNRFVEDKISRALEKEGIKDARIKVVGVRGFS